MYKVYRIHPSIGIARIGNSRTSFFDGPAVPDIHFLPPDGNFRDGGYIRRQAVRFYVFEFDYEDELLSHLASVRRLTAADADISWTVHLANTKSFTYVNGVKTPIPNNPGPKTVSGGDPPCDIVGHIFNTDVQLGTIEAIDDATLRVLGGFGESGPPATPHAGGLHWPDWYDDVGDGPVKASIRLKIDGTSPPVDSAWVVTGVPKFATPIEPIVTMYDVAYDIAIRYRGFQRPKEVSFSRDILPVLRRAVMFQWVEERARSGHGTGRGGDFLTPDSLAQLSDPSENARAKREDFFRRLKNPAGGGGDMPKLKGPPAPETPKTNGLSLTSFQYECFEKWRNGNFIVNDWDGLIFPKTIPLDDLAPELQPEALDRACLDTGIGGTYGPGIEVGMRFGEEASFGLPFRINESKLPGFLTSTLSIPWQVDYSACREGWWPSARPNSVMIADGNYDEWARSALGDNMLTEWWKLAFIKKQLENGIITYRETERM